MIYRFLFAMCMCDLRVINLCLRRCVYSTLLFLNTTLISENIVNNVRKCLIILLQYTLSTEIVRKKSAFPNEYMIEVRYKDAFFLRKGHNGMNRLNEILIVRFSLFLILTNISQKSRVILYTYSRQRTPSSMSLVKQILTTWSKR